LKVTIFVVDNNSTDDTAEVVAEYRARMPNLEYVFEARQGSSAAMNAGIVAGTGEILATLNDDEEVAVQWLEVLHEFFANTDYDFAGGPYQPNWSMPKPEWVTREHGAIIGWVDAGDEATDYGPGFNAMLMAGNAAYRRSVFDRVGLFNPALGRGDTGLQSCEDEEMFTRLLAAGLKGRYLPELVIYHYVPPERLTREYHRRWCWGHGISYGLLARTRKPEAKELFGIPRWRIRQALAGAVGAVKGLLHLEEPGRAFSGELRAWDLAGYVYGRLFRRTPRVEPRRPTLPMRPLTNRQATGQ
jgi:glycosyltransferase involved in cell wall biosynthesis